MRENKITLTKVATIIVTYNGQEWIERCISSLSQSDVETDIYVVDNASTDQTLRLIEPEKCAEIISLNKNYGFGYANNVMLKEALELNYDFCFLVNQDVYVEPETLGQIIEFAKTNKDFGIICPIQFDGSGKKIDFNFADYLSKSIEKEKCYEASFVNAAAWLISKKCIQTVGLFSHLFPHYGEDKNYCHRALFHEYKIGIVKNTKVLHDRRQEISFEKAIKLGKIKLLTIFLNPNLSETKSFVEGLKNIFGISKYLFKKYKNQTKFQILSVLLSEYVRLLFRMKELVECKERSKSIFLKNDYIFLNKK